MQSSIEFEDSPVILKDAEKDALFDAFVEEFNVLIVESEMDVKEAVFHAAYEVFSVVFSHELS